MEHLVFYCLGTVAVLAALLVVLLHRAVYSALALIVCFGATAGLFFQLGAAFLAVIQVIIYAGAIMVLFLFVIMLLDPESEEMPGSGLGMLPLVSLPLSLIVGFILLRALSPPLAESDEQLLTPATEIETLARIVFREYLLAFEITSILMLVAVMGAVMLTRRGA